VRISFAPFAAIPLAVGLSLCSPGRRQSLSTCLMEAMQTVGRLSYQPECAAEQIAHLHAILPQT
jgi:hypothetical protein